MTLRVPVTLVSMTSLTSLLVIEILAAAWNTTGDPSKARESDSTSEREASIFSTGSPSSPEVRLWIMARTE